MSQPFRRCGEDPNVNMSEDTRTWTRHPSGRARTRTWRHRRSQNRTRRSGEWSQCYARRLKQTHTWPRLHNHTRPGESCQFRRKQIFYVSTGYRKRRSTEETASGHLPDLGGRETNGFYRSSVLPGGYRGPTPWSQWSDAIGEILDLCRCENDLNVCISSKTNDQMVLLP